MDLGRTIAAVVFALVATNARAEEPPANIKAYLDSIKLTPVQAKEERAEQIVSLKQQVERLAKERGEARKASKAEEVKRLSEIIDLVRQRLVEIPKEPLPTHSRKGRLLDLPPDEGDVGMLNTFADGKVHLKGNWQTAVVVSVVDEKNAVIRVGDGDVDDPLLWLEVDSTKGYVDDKELLDLPAVECIGTKAYTNAIGGKVTVPHVRTIDLSKWIKAAK
jgi:hypothetical protein